MRYAVCGVRCDAGNDISEAGGVAVAEALKENTTLTSLDLQSECSLAPPLQDMMSERRGVWPSVRWGRGGGLQGRGGCRVEVECGGAG